VSRIEQNGRMSLRRSKPPIKGGSAPEEEEEVYVPQAVTLRNLVLYHTVYSCVPCVSQNKQRLIPDTALIDKLLQPQCIAFTAVQPHL